MLINNFDPVALEIFSLEIRWYSLAYIFGIVVGWILAKKLFIQNIEVKNKSIINSPKCKKAINKANKIIKNKGRILVRKSGTEQKIRIMSESEDSSLNKLCVNIIKKSIQ